MSRWFVLFLCFASTSVFAHKNSDSYLYIASEQWRLDIAVEDLQRIYNLDTNPVDGRVTAKELRGAAMGLEASVLEGIRVAREGGDCPLNLQRLGVTSHSGEYYAAWELKSPCFAEPDGLTLNYDLLFDVDPLHRLLYRNDVAEQPLLGVLTPSKNVLDLQSHGPWSTVTGFFREGILHMVLGYDHLLFLLALLLPLVRASSGDESLRPLLWRCTGVVTAFTVSHSITLTAATLGWWQLPIQPVEIVIALSISVAALVALFGEHHRFQWQLAGVFGLIHGFGFASMLAGLMDEGSSAVLALASFNIGVEAAQLAVTVALVPLLVYCQKKPLYTRWGYPAVLLAVAATGLWWAWQRV